MIIYLRHATAGQIRELGSFVDATDGKAPETTLTIANTDIRIYKAGATSRVAKNSGGATHMDAGHYYATFDATDSDTIGNASFSIDVAGALQVEGTIIVLDETVYDVLFGTVAPSTLAAGALMGLVDDAITAAKVAAGAIGSSEAPLLANLDAAISTRSTYAGGDTSGVTTLLARLGTPAGASIAADVATRLAAASYTEPDNTGIGEANAHAHAIDARLPSDPADESILEAAIASRAVAGDAMTLDASAITAIWAKTLGPATVEALLRGMLAAILGKTPGAGTGTIHIRNLADTADFATATVNEATGERITISINWANI
jgi:hypothetical protein